MNAVRATWKDGQIVLHGSVNWPEGCDLVVEPLPNDVERIGLAESQWRDDPASLNDWDAWIKTIEPLELTPEEEARFARFREDMQRFNVEAVRRKMEEKPLP